MIELPVGTELLVNGQPCIVKEGRSCTKCVIREKTAGRKGVYGDSLQCGTRYNGNTSDFICDKDRRSDKKHTYFAKL